jgi:hypothetical protein
MEAMLAEGTMHALPLLHIEHLLVQELIAARESLVPFLKAAPARYQWFHLRPVLRAAVRVQAHARAACIARSIGAAIRQRAAITLATAGASDAERYLQSTEGNEQLQRQLRFDEPVDSVGRAHARQPVVLPAAVAAPRPPVAANKLNAPSTLQRYSASAGLSGAAAIRRQSAKENRCVGSLPHAGSREYVSPSGNRQFRHLERFAPAASVQQLPASPTVTMMQRARAARSNMPVYSPQRISPSITDGRSMQMSPAAVIMTRAAAAVPHVSHAPPDADGASENVSPSVIWVGASGLNTPSAAAAPPPAAADAWPRLRDMLEASLHSHGHILAVGDDRWDGRERGSIQLQLETEIALMQVRACGVRARAAATVTLARGRAGSKRRRRLECGSSCCNLHGSFCRAKSWSCSRLPQQARSMWLLRDV